MTIHGRIRLQQAWTKSRMYYQRKKIFHDNQKSTEKTRCVALLCSVKTMRNTPELTMLRRFPKHFPGPYPQPEMFIKIAKQYEQ